MQLTTHIDHLANQLHYRKSIIMIEIYIINGCNKAVVML